MRVAVVLALAALAVCGAAGDGVARVGLRRRRRPAAHAFRLPWHKRWAPPAPAGGRDGVDEGGGEGGVPRQTLVGDLTALGEYYVELRVGGQVVHVQVDTGSSTLAVPLKQCVNCLPRARRFDMAKARRGARLIPCDSAECGAGTCRLYRQCEQCSAGGACCSRIAPSKCGFFLGYADGSGAAGALVEAVVGIAGMEVPLTFGSILQVSRGFENYAVDGILGMAYPSLSCNPTCVTPLFDALVKEGKVARDVFGLCTGKHGGQLLLGGSDAYFYDGALQYAPIRSKHEDHFYDVAIRATRVGGRRVRLPNFDVGIVDSGTTVLVVTTGAYLALRGHFQTRYCHVPGLCPARAAASAASRAWAPGGGRIVRVAGPHGFGLEGAGVARDANVSYGMGAGYPFPYPRREADGEDVDTSWFNPAYCGLLTDAEVRLLPDISIELEGGVKLTVAPDDYMLKHVRPSPLPWRRVEFRCLGITPMKGLDGMENNVIIGDSWLQKFYVEYDRENHRVGFAPSKNCVLPGQELTPWLKEDDELPEHAQERRGTGAGGFLIVTVIGCAIIWCLGTMAPSKREYTPIS